MDAQQWAALIFTAGYTIVASAGFWRFFSRRQNEKDAEILLLLGMASDDFHARAASYIDRGWIYREEYESLLNHIYKPYKVLGGNGTADRIMEEVGELPFRNSVKPLSFYLEERLMRRDRRDTDATER